MNDALYFLSKTIDKIRKPTLPTFENLKDSNDLQGEGIKIIILPNIINIYTLLEILQGLKLTVILIL